MTGVDVWGEDRPLGRVGLARDVAMALAVGLLGLAAGGTRDGWTVATVVLLSLALVVRRVWLWVAFGLAVAGGLTQLVGGQVNAAADLAYAPLAFSFGAHRSPRVRRAGLVAAVAGVLTAGVWAGLHRFVGSAGVPQMAGTGLIMTGLSALVLLGGWLTGFVRWQRREAIRTGISARLQAAEERRLQDLVDQERERTRIAADMHDVVAHSWAVVAAQADGARYLLRTDPDRAEAALSVIGETARGAMDDVRLLLGRLREPGAADPADPGDDLGFEAPEVLVGRMRASGMSLTMQRSGIPSQDPGVALTTRRILAEALTNALKHGDLDAPVRVVEDWSGAAYRLRVENACPARLPLAGGHAGPAGPVAPTAPTGHGLLGMTERVEAAGGTMSAGVVDPGRRWAVEVEIPCGAPRDAG